VDKQAGEVVHEKKKHILAKHFRIKIHDRSSPKPSAESGHHSSVRSIRHCRCEEYARQAPRSGALFFRPFLLGDAKEMDKRI